MNDNSSVILERGIQCLTKNLGDVEAEVFISLINREKIDYTEWQRQFYDSMDIEEISNEAGKANKEHPYSGKAKRL